MALVGYSDSEGSSDESGADKARKKIRDEGTSTAAHPKSTTTSKLIQRTASHKIRVNLPRSALASDVVSAEEQEPPAKRVRTGNAGAFAGFGASLPAPKNLAAKPTQSGGAAGLKKIVLGGTGISDLKTGAAPSFERSATRFKEQSSGQDAAGTIVASNASHDEESETKPVQLVGKATVFKPLSVSRNKPKPKARPTTQSQAPRKDINTEKVETVVHAKESALPTAKPKKPSLFSLMAAESLAEDTAEQDDRPSIPFDSRTESPPHDGHALPSQSSQQALDTGQSLESIASDMNLTAAERRQLFGRKANGTSNVPVVQTFSTEDEYAANQAMIARGDNVETTKAVRSIAPGRHSLQQLVSAVSNQKEALEESFAAGKRNKREAGGRYGW